MKSRWPALLGLALLASAGPASAHHSYAMYDRTKQITLEGVVKEFQWTNPHIFIEVDLTAAVDGHKEWSIEGTSPGVLSRQGWKYNSLLVGDKVTVVMSPLKDGRPGGILQYVTKNGQRLGDPTLEPGRVR